MTPPFAALDAHRHTLDTPSGPISYLDLGDPEAPAALFVHGVGTNSYLWGDVLEGVRDLRRCLAVDLPLHGHSPARPDQDFSLGALAEVLAQVVDGLGLDAVDLVANDTGGAVAQVFAARHPDRLRSFTLTNCDTHDNLPPEDFRPVVELARAGQLAPGLVQTVEQPDLARSSGLGDGYEHPERLGDDIVRAFLGPVGGTLEAARQFERCLVALDASELLEVEPLLAKLEVPTLIVWGTGDQFFDVSWAHWLHDLIPGVTEVVEVPGAKLFFPHERPDDLVPHLRRHLASVG